jgi:hypothetical protein
VAAAVPAIRETVHSSGSSRFWRRWLSWLRTVITGIGTTTIRISKASRQGALRYQCESRADHHEQQRGQGFGGPGRKKSGALEFPVEVDRDRDEQQAGQPGRSGDNRGEERHPDGRLISPHHKHFR